jgi:hypothetical protein
MDKALDTAPQGVEHCSYHESRGGDGQLGLLLLVRNPVSSLSPGYISA